MYLANLRKTMSLEKMNLGYRLNLIFGLFFIFPVAGFIVFAIKYDILQDSQLPWFFLGILVFSLAGIFILRKIFGQIANLSAKISSDVAKRFSGGNITGANELQNIALSYEAIERQLTATFSNLERKIGELATLKELSEICYVTFDQNEILYVILERALSVVKADIGSVLLLEESEPKAFRVQASIGLGELAKVGDRIEFENSIAKYAVINKSAIIVADIETDTRFGRINRPNYATKSFICIPIKTSRNIIGVMNISRKNDHQVFVQGDVEALAPLLSNGAFSYENIQLVKDNQKLMAQLGMVDELLTLTNSSLRGDEIRQTFFKALNAVLPYETVIVLMKDENSVDHLKVTTRISKSSLQLLHQIAFKHSGTIYDYVLKHGQMTVVEDIGNLESDTEKDSLEGAVGPAGAFIPLKIDGRPRGILVLTAQNGQRFYAARELIERVSDILALVEERQQLEVITLKRQKDLDTIKQIGSVLAASTFDLEQVLNNTMSLVQRVLSVEAGSLLLVDDGELRFSVAFGTDMVKLKSVRLKLGQGIAGYVAIRGHAVIANDASQSSHFYDGVDRITGFKTRSALCVPMITQGKVTGVIEVLNKLDDVFNQNDQQLLQSIASSVGIAIENVRLYRETIEMAEHERGVRNIFQKYVPKQVLEKIISGEESGSGVNEELKTITLLNIDIRNFSKLTRKIGPQKTVSLLNHIFSVMGGIVLDNGGIIDKYLGDGFLALFGAPVSSTVDADNAVLTALAMQKAMPEIRVRFKSDLNIDIHIGISVHTGEVVVGNFGFERKMDYTVIGDAVNGVFRLQKHTHKYPDGILISESTLRAVQKPIEAIETDIDCTDLSGRFGKDKVFELH